MGIEWGKLLEKSLGFCWRPKRWLPFFAADFVCILLAFLYVYYNMGNMLSMLLMISLGNFAYVSQFFAFLVPIGLLGVAYILINLWISGAVIYQSHKEREFRKSFGISWRAYPSLLAAAIVTGIITYVVSFSYLSNGMASAVYVGMLLSFIVSAALYFPMQIIMLKKQGFWNALVGSWQLFKDQARKKIMKRKNVLLIVLISEILSMPVLLGPSYLAIHTAVAFWIFSWFLIFAFLSLIVFSRVCDAMILVSIVSFIIVLIFSIPLLIVFWSILQLIQVTYSLSAGALALMGMAYIIRDSLLPLLTSGVILIIGLSISKAFSLKAQTEFYLKFRKRIAGLI